MSPQPPTPPARPSGRSLPLTLPRRWVGDLLHFARKVPSVPVQRRMDLRAVVAARRAAAARPAWVAIFAKAFARVAAEVPELRRAYLAFPRPHLYEHPESIAAVAVEREYRGENAVFFTHLRTPDRQTLGDLDAHLRRFREEPVERFGSCRLALRVSRLWRPLRRMAWWCGLNISGRSRAKRFGTFGVSVYSGLGADSLHPISPLTSLLNYGPISPRGRADVRVVYDHRVLDGATVARALGRLEEVLAGEIVAELQGPVAPPAGRPEGEAA